MKITKVLNNNSAVVLDAGGREIVVCGRGICYKKRIGDEVDPQGIEKKLYLADSGLSTKFQEIIASLPMEWIHVIEKIIKEVKLNLGERISDSIYVSLSDHLHFALSNHEKGIVVKNNILYDIARFYPDEYALGKRGLCIIEQETGVRLPIDEAGFIALHIVNAETENGIGAENLRKATILMEEIMDTICNFFHTDVEDRGLAYYRLLNHLRYFSQRIVDQKKFNKDPRDQELLDILKVKYEASYTCGLRIVEGIKERYSTEVGYDELLYLTIHIQRTVFPEKGETNG